MIKRKDGPPMGERTLLKERAKEQRLVKGKTGVLLLSKKIRKDGLIQPAKCEGRGKAKGKRINSARE